jgi:two-component system KDP operon response regulator KdpE
LRTRALVVACTPPRSFELLTKALRSRGLAPIVAVTAEHAIQLVRKSRPDVAILLNGAASPPASLIRQLEQRDVPVVLVAASDQIRQAAGMKTAVAAVPAPGDPEEIAVAAEVAVGDDAVQELPNSFEIGSLRIDFAARLVYLEQRRVPIPPLEFGILAELARQAGRPVASADLIRRVWPKNPSITCNDVHNHIYRLREIIGDHERAPPLIVNRRGYGYVLDLPND